jgi:DnaJ like chaperone protein
MAWWGKIIGGTLGFFVGGPVGVALGVLLGHSFDKGLSQDFEPLNAADREKIQQAFFNATFMTMGRIAKIDGRVSEAEIEAARQVMSRMGLDDALRQMAIERFNQGKSSEQEWLKNLQQFAKLAKSQRNLRQMFLEMQIQFAFADGHLDQQELLILERLATQFDFSTLHLHRLIAMVQAQMFFYQQHQQHQQHQQQWQSNQNEWQGQSYSHQSNLEQAYQLLGIDANASDQDVKKAYRKLMAQNHPDKLVARGLPEEMIKVATEKTQEIKLAYETIMESRKHK